MKKAFLVTGPEGSGTMMMSRALSLSGVQEVLRGIHTYNTNYEHLITGFPSLVWLHRSLPSAGIWSDLTYAKCSFEKHGYEIIPIFMTREPNATYLSQKRRDNIRQRDKSEKNMIKAFNLVCASANNFTHVPYEAFVSSEGFRRWLFTEKFGLPMTTIEVRNENEKYYR